MGFNRILQWLLPVLMSLFLVTGCGDLEPEMQDTRTVILKMDFNQKSSSRSSSSVSASELSQYNTHLILALPSREYLTSNYRNYYSSFAQGLMNPQDKKVSLEIPLNTQMKIFAFLFKENYSMSQLFSGTREVGYYGESQSFSIGSQTNNLSLGITLIQVPGTGTDTGGETDTTDTTAPTVSSIYPTDNQIGVSVSGNISVTFSEAMDTTYVTTNTSDTYCAGTLRVSSNNFSTCVKMSSSPNSSNSDKTFTVDPSDNLSYSTTYKIRVTTGVKDSAGNTLSSQYETSNGFTTSGLFVTWGNSGTILTSSDGTTWYNRTSGTSNHLYGITYGKSTFVGVGASGTILTSSDGTTWYNRTSGTSNGLYEVTYGNNTFVTVGPSGKILTSSDGTTWDSRTSGTSVTLWGVTYGNSTFVTVGSSGVILSSSDGTTWDSRTSGTSNLLYGVNAVTYGNNTYITVGDSGLILTSNDGISWTSRTSGTTNNLRGINYRNSTFVVVGISGTILTSSDGASWTSRISGTSNSLYGVGFANNTFVAVGVSGTILTSSDGITWNNRTSGTTNTLWGVTY